MPVSERTYERVALEDPEGRWELACGRDLRRKPPMTTPHEDMVEALAVLLRRQLPWNEYGIRTGSRLRLSTGANYLPDLFVVPRAWVRQRREQHPYRLDAYTDPIPLVVEVWSRRTGTYDVEEKLREYQRRGDLEIWRIHPYQLTLTTWRRQTDGSSTERVYRTGTVQLAALPGVTIDLDELFSMT